jgi:hypothetical protein
VKFRSGAFRLNSDLDAADKLRLVTAVSNIEIARACRKCVSTCTPTKSDKEHPSASFQNEGVITS